LKDIITSARLQEHQSSNESNLEESMNASPPLSRPEPAEALRQVSGPAVGLLITGIIGGLLSITSLVIHAVGLSFSPFFWDEFPDK